MLEYSLDDAEELLKKNKESAEKNVQQIAFDLGLIFNILQGVPYGWDNF